jgi:hypothetical protein
MSKGDALASGATKAVFQTANSKVSQEAWDKIFQDYDPENSKKEAEDAKKNRD